jgi:hypothetical protein
MAHITAAQPASTALAATPSIAAANRPRADG